MLWAGSNDKATALPEGAWLAVRVKVAKEVLVVVEKPEVLVLAQAISTFTVPPSALVVLTGQVQSPLETSVLFI